MSVVSVTEKHFLFQQFSELLGETFLYTLICFHFQLTSLALSDTITQPRLTTYDNGDILSAVGDHQPD